MYVVIGATGNVGRAVVHQLAARGHEVRAVSRDPGRVHWPAGVTPHAADLQDPAAVAAALVGTQGVFTLSGYAGVDEALAGVGDADVPHVALLSSSSIPGSGPNAVRAYHESFGLPITISNCCNNYGPYQFPEKVIPLFTVKAIDDSPLPLYESVGHRREWLHVIDHCRAIEAILERGEIGETYNVGSGVERNIAEIADGVLAALGKPADLKTIVPDRPGHDRRYLLDSSKIRRELGWAPEIPFEQGLADTIAWYAANRAWWEPLRERAPVEETAWAGQGRP